MQVYGDRISGNCLKVQYTADYLGLDYDWVDTDIMAGESRTPEYLDMNPAGQVPLLVLDDGRGIAQSNAIIGYLAEGSDLLPADAYERAKTYEWMFWEQYSHEPYVAVCRFVMVYEKKPASEREGWRVERGDAALNLMEQVLEDRDWFAGSQVSIADIALIAYTRLAHEGGFDLGSRPRVRAWIERTEGALGIN
ncbi:MAG: glutathione S-transferase family protein [Gammaproteobacteria bacterium]|jgi:glutathione S-transferase|nr:MAG: glutathione S-transferase family protein [Gammaproteobacteria bacterium]